MSGRRAVGCSWRSRPGRATGREGAVAPAPPRGDQRPEHGVCLLEHHQRVSDVSEPTPEARLSTLGIQLPRPNPAVANFVGAVTLGQAVFVSGHGPYRDGEYIYQGKLGAEIDVATGQQAARLTIINLLASLKAEIGELDRVTRVVKLLVLVNSAPEFAEQHLVANGASDPSRCSVRSAAATPDRRSAWQRCHLASRSRSRVSSRSDSLTRCRWRRTGPEGRLQQPRNSVRALTEESVRSAGGDHQAVGASIRELAR